VSTRLAAACFLLSAAWLLLPLLHAFYGILAAPSDAF